MDILFALLDMSAVVFAFAAMLSLGLGAQSAQAREALRRTGPLVVAALLVNVAVLPAVALAVSRILPVDVSLGEGLLLTALAAGWWTLPSLARSAGLDRSAEVGLRVVLVLASVAVIPVAVPLLLGDGAPGIGRLAGAMAVVVLLPVVGGMAWRARSAAVADRAGAASSLVSRVSLGVLVLLFLALHAAEVIGLVVSGILLMALVLVLVALGAGYLVGGLAPGRRGTHAVGAAQRNLPVAVLLAAVGFGGNAIVMAMVLTVAGMGLLVTAPIAIRIGRRADPGEAAGDPATGGGQQQWRLLRRRYRAATAGVAVGMVAVFALAIVPRGDAGSGAAAGAGPSPIRVVDVSDIEDEVIIEKDVPIVVRDGTRLAANIYRPARPGAYPVVMAFTAYGKDRGPDQYPPYLTTSPAPLYDFGTIPVSPWTSWEAPDPAFWVPEGYVVVYVDARGYFASEGEASVLSEQDGEDFHDAIEWAAGQEWSNGRVGLNGVSYLAIAQWAAAATSPPSLRGIIAWEGQTDAFREVIYHGGIPETAFISFWADRLRSGANQPPIPPPLIFDFVRERPRLLEAVQDAPAFDLPQIDVPALICASWSDQGLHTRGSFEAFKQISSEQKWLYTHGGRKWDTYYGEEALAAQLRFFDAFLKGEDNGMDEVPRVRLEVREDLDTSQVRAEGDWPLPGTDYHTLYLDPAAQSLEDQPPPDVETTTYEPFSQSATFNYTFDEDTELTGNMSLRLWVSTDRGSDMDLFVGVGKVDAQGQDITFYGKTGYTLTPAALGWLRVSERATDPDRSTPAQPVLAQERAHSIGRDEIVAVDIEILPSSTFFRAGDSLRLVIQGEDLFDHVSLAHDSSVNQGSHTIYSGGQYDSRLLIPVIPQT